MTLSHSDFSSSHTLRGRGVRLKVVLGVVGRFWPGSRNCEGRRETFRRKLWESPSPSLSSAPDTYFKTFDTACAKDKNGKRQRGEVDHDFYQGNLEDVLKLSSISRRLITEAVLIKQAYQPTDSKVKVAQPPIILTNGLESSTLTIILKNKTTVIGS